MSGKNFEPLVVTRKEIRLPLKKLCKAGDERYRSKTWKQIRAKLIDQGRFNPKDPEHKKILLAAFHEVSPTPPELFQAIKAKRNDPTADREQILRELKIGLDLVANEADHWMWRLWPEPEKATPKARPKKTRQPSAEDQFVEAVRQRQEQNMVRRQAWLEVEALQLLESAKGFFIGLWKFREEEFISWEQTFLTEPNGKKPKTRRLLWQFLVDKLVINPADHRELAAFRRVFFKISGTPEELLERITELKQTLSWNRFQARQELIREFSDQTIPGEIDHHLNKIWPESKKTAALETAAA